MTLHALHMLARALPFPLDDTAQVNSTFERWHAHEAPADKDVIDLWTYCFIYRYFLIKLARPATALPFDRAVTNAFADVQQHLAAVRCPDRYTGWVGAICRNAFVNYLRMRRTTLRLEEERPALVAEEPPYVRHHDASVIHASISAAIERLPPYLRRVAHLRLLENRSYEAISRTTGHPPATLRAYVNKSCMLLRRTPRLQALVAELQD